MTRVAFDFDGSLELARTLWRLSEDLATTASQRSSAAERLLGTWVGGYSSAFTRRMTDEQAQLAAATEQLREDAQSWARAWTRAVTEQQDLNYAAEVERVRSERGWLEQTADVLLGDDSADLVWRPPDVEVPQPPQFAATASTNWAQC